MTEDLFRCKDCEFYKYDASSASPRFCEKRGKSSVNPYDPPCEEFKLRKWKPQIIIDRRTLERAEEGD